MSKIDNESKIKKSIERAVSSLKGNNPTILIIESKISKWVMLSLTVRALRERGIENYRIVWGTFYKHLYKCLQKKNFRNIKSLFFSSYEDFSTYINSMNNKFNLIIMNPPYKLGNRIWSTTRKLVDKDDSIVCLMPPSYLKKNKEYKYVGSIQTIGGEGFNATISNNNSIIMNCVNPNNMSYEDISFMTFNQNYILYYKWNKDNFRGLTPVQSNYLKPEDLDIDVDFIESSRCCSSLNQGGAGYGTGGCGYFYNVKKVIVNEKDWISCIARTTLPTPKAKDNFSKWWYYKGKGKSLSSKTMMGVGYVTISPMCKYALPQIDWEAISDHPLWIEGKLDIAVLDVMGLKWNETMDGVIKK